MPSSWTIHCEWFAPLLGQLQPRCRDGWAARSGRFAPLAGQLIARCHETAGQLRLSEVLALRGGRRVVSPRVLPLLSYGSIRSELIGVVLPRHFLIVKRPIVVAIYNFSRLMRTVTRTSRPRTYSPRQCYGGLSGRITDAAGRLRLRVK